MPGTYHPIYTIHSAPMDNTAVPDGIAQNVPSVIIIPMVIMITTLSSLTPQSNDCVASFPFISFPVNPTLTKRKRVAVVFLASTLTLAGDF